MHDNLLRFAAGGHLGLFHHLIDVCHGFCLGLILDVLNQLSLSLFCGETRYGSEFFRCLEMQFLEFLFLRVDELKLLVEVVLDCVDFRVAALQFVLFLV